MVLYICIYDIINRKTYLKTLYLIPNTFKEWAENFNLWLKSQIFYANCDWKPWRGVPASRLGVQYPKNSKIFLWLLPQPSSGNALVCVDKNWNISGLLSGFQLEKLFFIHKVRSYSHSTATAEFVKATAGFVMSSEASDQLYFSHFSTFRFLLGNIWLFLG